MGTNVIFGTLLGDGCLSKDKTTWRLDISHCTKQFEYLKWKAEKIGFAGKFGSRTSGYGSTIRFLKYYNKEVLPEVARICITDGVKTISDEWLSNLDDISLAIWYQDDGSWGKDGPRMKNGDRCSRYITFSTEGFDSISVRKLCRWLNDRGYAAHVRISKKKYEVISLNHSATIKFWRAVAPYIVIRSKIDLGQRPGVIDCACGIPIEPKMAVCDSCLRVMAMNGLCSRFRLIRRFGTSLISEIERMAVVPRQVSRYWIDPDIVGSVA